MQAMTASAPQPIRVCHMTLIAAGSIWFKIAMSVSGSRPTTHACSFP